MVKGYRRQVIVLRDPPGKMFDTVYFIAKSDLPSGIREKDLLREAEKIVASVGDKPPVRSGEISPPEDQKKRPQRSTDGILAYFSGAATVGVAAGAIALAARLIL